MYSNITVEDLKEFKSKMMLAINELAKLQKEEDLKKENQIEQEGQEKFNREIEELILRAEKATTKSEIEAVIKEIELLDNVDLRKQLAFYTSGKTNGLKKSLEEKLKNLSKIGTTENSGANNTSSELKDGKNSQEEKNENSEDKSNSSATAKNDESKKIEPVINNPTSQDQQRIIQEIYDFLVKEKIDLKTFANGKYQELQKDINQQIQTSKEDKLIKEFKEDIAKFKSKQQQEAIKENRFPWKANLVIQWQKLI